MPPGRDAVGLRGRAEDMVAVVVSIILFGIALGAQIDPVAQLTGRYFRARRLRRDRWLPGGDLRDRRGPVLVANLYDRPGSYYAAMLEHHAIASIA